MGRSRTALALILGAALFVGGVASAARPSLSAQSSPISDIVNAVSQAALNDHVLNLQDDDDLPGQDGLRSRYSYNPGCMVEASYIYAQLASYGLSVYYDPFVLDPEKPPLANVVAEKPGRLAPSVVYIVAAHYDSTAARTPGWDPATGPAPGADDNASGTAAVLEVARVLSRYDFNHTIRFIAFSGEEQGLEGSKHYAQRAREAGEDIAAVINLDMIGYSDGQDTIYLVGNGLSDWLATMMDDNNTQYAIDLTTEPLTNVASRYSDHASFWDQGYNAILASENDGITVGYLYYHTITDTWDNLTLGLMTKVTRLTAATIAELAQLYQAATPTTTSVPTPTGTPTPVPAAILGSVELQGRANCAYCSWVITATLTLHNPGESSPLATYVLSTDATGHFTATGVSPGIYDIKVKGSHTLRNKKESVPVSSGSNDIYLGLLLEGDANDDTMVNITDFSVLAATFGQRQGQEGYDPRADFNQDTRVNITDFSLLSSNFGNSGDQPVISRKLS